MMKQFYVLNDDQKELYFKVVRELPEELYSIEDKDIEVLNRYINTGAQIEPEVLRRLRYSSVFLRILKEIKIWSCSDSFNSSCSCPSDIKKKELLDWVNNILEL